MDELPQQEFRLGNGYIWFLRFGVIFFTGMAILSLASPYLPDDKPVTVMMSVVLSIGFLGFSIFTYLVVRKLPYCNVSVDTDGLWYSHLSKKDGLTEWQSIQSIRERAGMQRLDLLGNDNQLLIKVEYQLNDFELLRSFISERVLLKNQIDVIPVTYSNSLFSHLFIVMALIGFSTLGWYVGSDGNQLLGYGGMSFIVGLILYEYLISAWKLELREKELIAFYPLSRRRVGYHQIQDIEMSDTFIKGARHPEVLIFVQGEKPIKLKGLNVKAIDLYATLKSIKE